MNSFAEVLQMSIDRNKLCPCKSGIKIKKCCAVSCCESCLSSPENLGAVEKGWTLKNSLVRCKGKHHLPTCPTPLEFNPETVVLCGNGSVYWIKPNCLEIESNAWDVVQEYVNMVKASSEGAGVGIPSTSMNFLHYLAASEKVVSYVTKEYSKHNDQYVPIQQAHSKFRKQLGEAFLKADISLRDMGCFHCKNTHYKSVSELSHAGFITLNWDGAIRKLPNTIELHGNCESPKTLILPNQDLTHLLPRDMQISQGFEAFAVAHHWLASCKNIIIWGCGLNDYDAIIPVIMSIFSLKTHDGHIGIFVSEYDAKKREEIEKKLADYFPLGFFYKCLNEIDLKRR